MDVCICKWIPGGSMEQMKSVNLCRGTGRLAVGDQLTPPLTRANRDELLSACLRAYIIDRPVSVREHARARKPMFAQV